VLEELVDILERWEKPPEMFIMPPIGDIDAIKFAKLLNAHSDTFLWLKQGIFEEKADEEAYLRSFKTGTFE